VLEEHFACIGLEHIHCEASFFLCIVFSTLQKLVNFFFAYIRPMESRSISYNSMYLILSCIENFAATVTLKLKHQLVVINFILD